MIENVSLTIRITYHLTAAAANGSMSGGKGGIDLELLEVDDSQADHGGFKPHHHSSEDPNDPLIRSAHLLNIFSCFLFVNHH